MPYRYTLHHTSHMRPLRLRVLCAARPVTVRHLRARWVGESVTPPAASATAPRHGASRCCLLQSGQGAATQTVCTRLWHRPVCGAPSVRKILAAKTRQTAALTLSSMTSSIGAMEQIHSHDSRVPGSPDEAPTQVLLPCTARLDTRPHAPLQHLCGIGCVLNQDISNPSFLSVTSLVPGTAPRIIPNIVPALTRAHTPPLRPQALPPTSKTSSRPAT